MARKILISRRDWLQQSGVAFSGGSWQQPLTNMIDPRTQLVAMAADNDWTSTTFDVALGVQRNNVGLVHFQNFRTTQLGVMRLRLGLAGDFSTATYDSGWVSTWPQDSDPLTGLTAWGDWTATGTYASDEYVALNLPRFFIPPAVIQARYVRLEVHDNSAIVPLAIGAMGVCEVWEPPLNFQYGWSITPLDESDISNVPYGSSYITQRGKRNRFSFGFPALPEAEMLAKGFGLGRLKGKSQPLAAVLFPDDGGDIEKRAVWGLVSQDSAISNPFFGRYAYPFQIDQLI